MDVNHSDELLFNNTEANLKKRRLCDVYASLLPAFLFFYFGRGSGSNHINNTLLGVA